MRPSQVRDHNLADHEELRKALGALEELAGEVLAGDRHLVGPLRDAGEAFLRRLREHMHWEDRFLAQALREADAWGEERAAELEREHSEQRTLLAEELQRLRQETRPPHVVARELVALASRLREDMETEERHTLDERVLRDDVIAIHPETG